ncbi:Uncharacterised protein [Mycobacterium tuberculosis]|nr:Uncharacterised protein [Mycobacterium tuberculosis]
MRGEHRYEQEAASPGEHEERTGRSLVTTGHEGQPGHILGGFLSPGDTRHTGTGRFVPHSSRSCTMEG